MAGTSAGLDHSPTTAEVIAANVGVQKFSFAGGTIFDALGALNIPWRIAYGDVPITLAIQGLDAQWANFVKLDDFLAQMAAPGPVKADDPAFVFIEPKYDPFNNFLGGNSMHACGNFQCGEVLVKQVYDAFRNSRFWFDSALLIVFDEHGGFFDHGTPPTAVKPDNDLRYARHNFDFCQLGVRVPAIVVSAYTPAGTVDHSVYDHSSILATLDVLLNQGGGQLCCGSARAQAAADFSGLFSLQAPRSCNEVPADRVITTAPVIPAAPLLDRLLGDASAGFMAVALEMGRLKGLTPPLPAPAAPAPGASAIQQVATLALNYQNAHFDLRSYLDQALNT